MKNEWRDIYLCRQTLLEMLKDRKYNVNLTTQSLTLQQFKQTYPTVLNDRNAIKIHVSRDEDSALSVHFFDETKVGLKTLKLALETFERQSITHIVLVCKEGLSPACKKYIQTLNICIEIFYEKELLFNVTKHFLVPHHRILEMEERNELLKNLRCIESQLPLILEQDPVIRYLGGRKGEIIEILRDSITAGKTRYYRLVV